LCWSGKNLQFFKQVLFVAASCFHAVIINMLSTRICLCQLFSLWSPYFLVCVPTMSENIQIGMASFHSDFGENLWGNWILMKNMAWLCCIYFRVQKKRHLVFTFVQLETGQVCNNIPVLVVVVCCCCCCCCFWFLRLDALVVDIQSFS
jgi:hypothetical protein